MRVRVVLALTLAAVLAGLAIDMSGRQVRISGTDHISPVAFVASVPSRGRLCQPGIVLPADAHSVQMLIGTYGQPVPALSLSFAGADGRAVSSGRLPAGAREGSVSVALSYPHGPSVAGTLCLKLGRLKRPIVFAGEAFGLDPIAVHVNGAAQPGRIDLTYMRGERESWWQLLPTLVKRFGLGKASLFGDWTLPAMAALLGLVWILALRLLLRELR